MAAVERGIQKIGDSYRAEAFDRETGRRKYKTFPTRAAARAWRRDMQVKLANGTARAFEPTTVGEAWAKWLSAAALGLVRSRGGAEYKPSVLHSYESTMVRVLEKFGHRKVADIRRKTLQSYVDTLVGEQLAAQTIRNTINTMRVLFKWCVREELLSSNPCDGLELPSGGTARDRVVSPSEAIEILGSIKNVSDRAIYATAFFAGLRRGELMALRGRDIDLEAKTITVLRAYDPRTQSFGLPKSKAGARTLGIPELLVPYLQAHYDEIGVGWLWEDVAVLFPNEAQNGPFSDRALSRRVDVGLTLHEARHTYASLMIAAGVNLKTISEWMGHSSITITLDRYGHLLPGSASEALGLLNDYLAKEAS